MTKHHHQSRAEQIDNKAHGAKPFHFEKRTYDSRGALAADDSSIQARAHQIHHERGGSALENWLEAERTLRINA
jgi:hypothetical protein